MISKKYVDPAFPGSFSGLENFYKSLKTKEDVTKKDVTNTLLKSEAYTLHKPVKKQFTRNKIIVFGIDDTWQADLVDMQKFSKENKGFKYILTVIDVFSKYAWAEPLKSKQGEDICKAFQKIFNSKRIPQKLHVDQGTEFYNARFKSLLKAKNVRLYSTNSEVKACVVERFNRTLKERMWRMFTHFDNHVYYTNLAKLITSYNNTVHSSIKFKPVDVRKSNQDEIFLNLYGYQKDDGPEDAVSTKFEVGDLVRISRYKGKFEKGYVNNWSQEAYKISKVLLKNPPVYLIVDLDGEEILGRFYAEELTKIEEKDFAPDDKIIDQVVGSRRKKGVLEKQVRFQGSKRLVWIKASDIIK